MKFNIPKSGDVITLTCSYEIAVMNDRRCLPFLNIVKPNHGLSPIVGTGKERKGQIRWANVHFPVNTKFVIKSFSKEFAVLKIVHSPLLSFRRARERTGTIVISLTDLQKMNYSRSK